ncbi:MAG: hypothetical protein QOG50_729, partial [Actinomycetota bacterium]|nr:hypothetical protein [Actinomycetota bacterium]
MTAPLFFAGEYGVRTVSVLIVDTVDSVATKERIGQAHADDLYRPVELILRKAISRSGGHTVKGLGDGVLAIFPSASSALRAACSAFQDTATFNQTASEHVSLRAGVSVGDVALERDDIKGLAVDEAARLQAAADPDGVLLSDETYLTARGRTNCILVPGPELRLKGIEHSVKTWSIDWGASPESIDLEVQLPDKLVTELRSRFPFADRHAAMETLGAPVLGEQPRLTVVRGPSGVGKTRLLAEWLDHARHHGAFVFYSRSERQTSASERELGSALREFRTSLAHARLLASLPGYKRICEELESTWATSSRQSLAETDGGLLIEHLVDFLDQLGRDSPTILVIDNVQYATAATLDLVERILGRFSSSVRVVCVITNDLALDEMTISEERLLSRFPLSERVEIL